MVAFGPIIHRFLAAAVAALVLAPSAGALCTPCGSMEAAMDCCDHGPGTAAAPESCAGGELRDPGAGRTAADLSAPDPVPPGAQGVRQLLAGDVGPREGPVPEAPPPLPRTPHLYLLHASFLI